jgi:hypothetical protein
MGRRNITARLSLKLTSRSIYSSYFIII